MHWNTAALGGRSRHTSPTYHHPPPANHPNRPHTHQRDFAQHPSQPTPTPSPPPTCRFFGDELTWNLRDSHFLDTCKLILGHLSRRTQHPPRLVVWAHNSHLGDARATDMGQRRGELNIGQLMRQEFGMERVYNVGWAAGQAAAALLPPPLIPLDVAPGPCCLIRPAPLPFTPCCRPADACCRLLLQVHYSHRHRGGR